jgi:hypothetical protein
MKAMRDRKMLWLEVCLDDILSLLEKSGGMSHLSMDAFATEIPIPPDTRVVGAALHGPELVGQAKLRIALESDDLDERLRFPGHMMIFKPNL